MLALLLSLTPSPQIAGHAPLHSQDAEFYFEIPSFGVSAKALADSPMVRAVTAEKFREATGAYLDVGRASPMAIVEEILGEAGLDTGRRAAITQCLVGLTSASFSLRGSQAEALAVLHEKRRVRETLEELEALDKLLGGGWGSDLPSDLTGVRGISADLYSDAWGHDYVYERGEGRHYVLLSYGRDGERGGRYADSDLAPRKSWELAEIRAGLEGLGMMSILEFDDPLLAEQMTFLLMEGLAQTGVALESHALSGDEAGPVYFSFRDDELPDAEAWFFHRDERFFYGFGADSPRDLTARIDGPSKGLDSAPQFNAMNARLGEASGAVLCRGFATLEPMGYLFGMVGRVAPIEDENPFSNSEFLMEMYSLPEPMAWRMGFDGEHFVTESFRTQVDLSDKGFPRGAPRDLPETVGRGVPEDAPFVFVTTIDGEALGESCRTGLSAALGEAGGAVLETAVAVLGFDPVEDLIGNLKGELIVFSSAFRGPTSIPLTAMVGLEDEEAFQDALSQIADLANEKLSGSVRAKQSKFRGANLVTFKVSAPWEEAVPVFQFEPCFTVVGDKLLVTLSSIHAKREIKRLNALTGKEPLHPLFLDPAVKQPGVVSAWSMDWRNLIEGVDGIVRTLGPTLTAFAPPGEMPDIDWGSLPKIELITAYLQPSRGTVRRVDGGLLSRDLSSMGPETWFGAPALVFSTINHHRKFNRRTTRQRVFLETNVMQGGKVVIELEPEDEFEAYTLDAMGEVLDALGAYERDTGRFPQDLEVLLDGSRRRPNGYLVEPQFLNDAWGMPLIYESLREGRDFRLRSSGPDNEDANGLGDDLRAR